MTSLQGVRYCKLSWHISCYPCFVHLFPKNQFFTSGVTGMSQSEQKATMNWALLFFCWLLVSLSTTGSIFFSSVMEFTPCVLCWYQRICLFPQVLILGMGLVAFDKSVVKYSLPLAIAGWLLALYHTLLYSGIIPESIQPCSQGVSCTEEYIDLFGFLTIPMLSLLSFSILIALLLILQRRLSR